MANTVLTHTCAACGAEESLDALLARMVDDDQVRRLIADLLVECLPLGAALVRYLRLHKPAKHRLSMDKVTRLLAELVPDVNRSAIERNGRIWQVTQSEWFAALQAVFDAVAKGTLAVPLEGNGYLYGALMRMADKAEGAQEKGQERTLRGRSHQKGSNALGEVLQAATALAADMQAFNAQHGVPGAAPVRPTPPTGPRVDSPSVRAMKAAVRKAPATDPTNDLPTEERPTP